MKRKLTSYLFLTAGIALAFLLGGCTFNQAPISLSGHTMYATKDSVHVSLIGKLGDYQVEYYIKTLLYMKDHNITDLHIHLFTPGGSAVSMYGS